MRKPILLPELGAAPVVLSTWFAEPGETVFEGDRLVEVLVGGGLGGIAAMVVLAFAGVFRDVFLGTAAEEQASALLGTLSIGLTGYAAVVGQIVLVAAVTALTSRQVVSQTLAAIE